MAKGDVIPEEKSNERFKELGYSVYMVTAKIGLAQVEALLRTKRMVRVYKRWRKNPNSNISELLREIASVSDAIEKLKKAEGK